MKLHFSILVVYYCLFIKSFQWRLLSRTLLHRLLQLHFPLFQMQSEVRIRGAQLQNGRLHLCYATQSHLQACHSMIDKNLLQDGSLLTFSYQARAPPSHQCNSGIDISLSENFPKSPSNTCKQLVHNRVRESSGMTDPNQGSESKFGKPTETSRGSMSKCHSCLWKSPQLSGLFNPCSLFRH